jgi:hypothetical protein
MPVKDDHVKSGDNVTVEKNEPDTVTPPEEVPESEQGSRRNSRLNIQRRSNTQDPADVKLDRKRDVAPWDKDDAPKGSTSESLLTTDDNGKPVVSGETHYAHLANGQIVGSYGIGTHHTDADYNDGAPVPVATHFAG